MLTFGVVVAAFGCSSQPAPDPGPSACSDEAGYELDIVDHYDMVGFTNVFVAGDNTPGGTYGADVEPITDGDRCGSTAALVVRTSGYNDWGSLFGFSNFGPRDESAYEGMWFWARAPGNTNTRFTLLINDPNTFSNSISNTSSNSYCQAYVVTDGGSITIYDPTSGQMQPPSAPAAGQCGNSYGVSLTVTRDWRIYAIPFAQFQQANQPNRVPNSVLTHVGPVPGTALLTNALDEPIFRMPSKSQTELWIDDLGFYRKRAAIPGADAATAADAAQM